MNDEMRTLFPFDPAVKITWTARVPVALCDSLATAETPRRTLRIVTSTRKKVEKSTRFAGNRGRDVSRLQQSAGFGVCMDCRVAQSAQ
jgi:hypothetical protein